MIVPLLARVGRFGRAVVRHAMDGLKQVTPEAREARLGACNDCPRLDPGTRVCGHPACGCYVDVKAGWRSETCPDGRWPLETTEPPEKTPGGSCDCRK